MMAIKLEELVDGHSFGPAPTQPENIEFRGSG